MKIDREKSSAVVLLVQKFIKDLNDVGVTIHLINGKVHLIGDDGEIATHGTLGEMNKVAVIKFDENQILPIDVLMEKVFISNEEEIEDGKEG